VETIFFISEQDKKEQDALRQAVEATHLNQAKLTIVSCFENLSQLILKQTNGQVLLKTTLAQ